MAPATGSPDGTEDRLRQLIDRGFKFIHPCDAAGEIIAIVGVRPHDDVIDVVHLRTEDDAEALRVPGDTEDVLAPDTHSWRSAGSTSRVLDDLLNLPDTAPAMETPGSGANGCWVHVGAHRAKWLSVTT
jgi:hypothetical protein